MKKYNFDEASSTIAFDICVRFTLTSDGMEVTIINEDIEWECPNCGNTEYMPEESK